MGVFYAFFLFCVSLSSMLGSVVIFAGFVGVSHDARLQLIASNTVAVI